MNYVITVDFGSTFTKVVVVNLLEKKIELTGKVPSTVGSDASICLEQCFELAKETIGEDEFKHSKKLASSSAAGGLRMSVIGLTESLSMLAGKSAALGAGAKVINHYNGILTDEMIQELENCKTEIILFCGGYEHGNTSMVLQNAEKLARSSVNVPIIYSGNSDLLPDIRKIMRTYVKKCFTVENIIPSIGVLNTHAVQEVIRTLFLDQIIDMKGFDIVKNEFDNQLVPTPVAVLNAGTLLSKGTKKTKGLGAVLIVDIGGSTTDIYSFNENKRFEGAKMVGLDEPFGKRTVEGDLGMRESSIGVIESGDISHALEHAHVSEEQFRQSIKKRMEDIDYLPTCEKERRIDDAIARSAVHLAARRHAGRVEPSFSQNYLQIQFGKNISEISKVIGTGGILVHNQNAAKIMKEAEKLQEEKGVLLPNRIEPYLDTNYVLFSSGLLREVDEEAAMEIMLTSIQKC